MHPHLESTFTQWHLKIHKKRIQCLPSIDKWTKVISNNPKWNWIFQVPQCAVCTFWLQIEHVLDYIRGPYTLYILYIATWDFIYVNFVVRFSVAVVRILFLAKPNEWMIHKPVFTGCAHTRIVWWWVKSSTSIRIVRGKASKYSHWIELKIGNHHHSQMAVRCCTCFGFTTSTNKSCKCRAMSSWTRHWEKTERNLKMRNCVSRRSFARRL